MYVFYFTHTDEPGKYYNWIQEKNQRTDTFINQEYLHECTNGGKTSFFNSGEERSIQPLPDRRICVATGRNYFTLFHKAEEELLLE